jgi:hypothetical protein
MVKTPVPAHGLSPRAEKTIRRLSSVTVIILAVGAAILSFSGLQSLAVQHGFDPRLAWLMPVIVDGMVLTGSLGVVASGLVGARTWYHWMLTAFGVAISVWGNVQASPADTVSQMVHAIPPLTFALSVEGMLRIYRASAHAALHREHQTAAAEDRRLDRELRTAERMARLQTVTSGGAAPVAPVPAPVSAPAPGRTPRPPRPAGTGTGTGTARVRVAAFLQERPDASGGMVARELGLDPSYTRKLVKELRGTAAGLRGEGGPAPATS